MHETVKKIVIAILIVLLTGCSATRRKKSTPLEGMTTDAGLATIISNVRNYNITDNGFVIKRGRIELDGTETDGSFSINARLNRKGDFFASVRGPLGIELVRFLAVGNDIAMIDRFNRTVYVGKKDAVMSKNGVPGDFIKALFGDMPAATENWNYRTTEKRMVILTSDDGSFETELTICNDELKICRERIRDSGKDREILLDFTDFRRSGEIKYPSAIVMNDLKKMVRVRLSIDDLVSGYDNEIEFSLPDYKRSSL